MTSTDMWLDTQGQARALGVEPRTIDRYRVRFGPGHRFPYPTHVPGQHRPAPTARKADEVSEAALLAWDAARAGAMGRPRTRPRDLTVPQWRALAAIADGRGAAPRLVLALTAKEMVKVRHGGEYVLSRRGSDLLARYPFPTTPIGG